MTTFSCRPFELNLSIRLSFFVLLLLSRAAGVLAQSSSRADSALAPVPFGPGERITYSVHLGVAGKVGDGSIEVERIDTVHGFETYRLRMHVKGGILFAKVRDEYRSWLDVRQLISRRFYQDVHEVGYDRTRTLEFFPAELAWKCLGAAKCADKMDSGPLPTAEPLDDLSFVFYARTLPLTVGETYTLNRYWKNDGNPVTIRVLRRDTVTVPAGTFPTIVVQPIIRTKGLFSEGGRAEIFFTDDERRIPVLINTRLDVPLLKSLKMQLLTYEPGKQIAPAIQHRVTSALQR